MNHSFNVEAAIECGIEEAILLENIFFWTEKNRANNENLHDGRYWTYNSMDAFAELFPYMNRRKIRYAIDKLRENGFIITANYNKQAMDKTLWYALTDKSYELLKRNSEPISKYVPDGQNCQIDVTKLSNGNDKNVQAIPYITSNINEGKKDIYSSDDSYISKEKSESPSKKKRFTGISPTLDQVETLIKAKGYHFDARDIIRYYTSDGEYDVWRFRDGRLVKDWKRCCITFEDRWQEKYGSGYKPGGKPSSNSNDMCDDLEAYRQRILENQKREYQEMVERGEINEYDRVPY